MTKFFSVMLLASIAHAAFCAEPPLYRAPLPELPPDQEVRMDEVLLPPGVAVPSHRHNAYVYVYVVEGTVEMQVAGGEVQRLSAGQVFTEMPQDIHSVMRNPSETEPARFVSFTIKAEDETGFTIVSPHPE